MLIMAIDHVRVYSGMPAGGATAGIFFTRWITHFCAPTFAFFAGTSAFLYFQKVRNRSEVVHFLLTRGVLLVILEMTVIRFAWMFNLDFATFNITGVIWMLGWCLILLALFVKLRVGPVSMSIIGLSIVFGQQIFHYVPAIFPLAMQRGVASVWGFFYPSLVATPKAISIAPGLPALPNMFGISIFYVILPWIGVMMAGYGFGKILLSDPETIRKNCLRLGISALFLFISIAPIVLLKDSYAIDDIPIIFKLLGQQKYPPSQLYILMTLGPIIALVPWAERMTGNIAEALKTIGRVPMFFYLIHIPLIHLFAFLMNVMMYGNIHQDWYETAPFVNIDVDNHWGLLILYGVWIVVCVILYFACVWYAGYKSRHPEKRWLKYI